MTSSRWRTLCKQERAEREPFKAESRAELKNRCFPTLLILLYSETRDHTEKNELSQSSLGQLGASQLVFEVTSF